MRASIRAVVVLAFACGPALAAPSRLVLLGDFGTHRVTANLTRTGDQTWEWVENDARFSFRAVLETDAQLVIYDRSRDIYHRLNLSTGETAWRIGTLSGGGEWNPHYVIVQSD
jgi:hypothetical protein